MNRRTLITMIHTLKTRHGLPDDSYRAHIARFASGKTSCTQCNVPELKEILSQLKKHLKRDPRLNKITALWLTNAKKGIVRDKSQRAMRKYCGQFCKLPLEQAQGYQLNHMIESLKAMGLRVTGSRA